MNKFIELFVHEEFLREDAPNMYKTFVDIGEVQEFWEFTLGPFVDGVSQKKYPIFFF
jgi:hypothetical protein